MKSAAVLATAFLTFSTFTRAMTIDQYMEQVKSKNKSLQSYDVSIEASQEKRAAGDIGLSPTLTAGYSLKTDKSQPATIAEQRDTRELSLGLSKAFSSGTSLSLGITTDKYEYHNPVTPGNNGYANGVAGITLQQSLWKDSFGSATRIRQEKELRLNQYEVAAIDLKRRSEVAKLEGGFWDYIVSLQDIKLKKSNLDRAKKLETWTSNRVYNGISDNSDLLQIKALVAKRELDLAAAEEEFKAQQSHMRENLGMSDSDQLPEPVADLSQSRPYVSQVSKTQNMIKLESYLSYLEAKYKKSIVESTIDSLKPDLTFTGKYYTNSYSATSESEMQSNLFKTDYPLTYVGLNLTWMFDTGAKNATLTSARKDSLATDLKAEQAKITGVNAWKEYLRKYELAKNNVALLEKISKLQSDRSKEEQSKFSKGRTITSNVVTAETDSAEAEVALLKAKSNLRKLEADTLLYTTLED